MIESFVLKMIERENQTFEDLRNSFSSERQLTKDDISRSKLSEFTKNYLSSTVEDYGNHSELLDRITKACKLRFNYAIRPKWTLLTYMFGSYESRPPADISKKLDLFPFYNFYIDSINDVLRDNFSIFITRNEVSLLIDETNKAIYRKLTTDINNAKIKNFFLQIYQLKYNEQDLNLESTIPYSFIKIFLNDKYYFDIEKKFQLVKSINDEYEISLKDVIKVLMNKYDFQESEERNQFVVDKEETAPEISVETKIPAKEDKNENPAEDGVIEKPVINVRHPGETTGVPGEITVPVENAKPKVTEPEVPEPDAAKMEENVVVPAFLNEKSAPVITEVKTSVKTPADEPPSESASPGKETSDETVIKKLFNDKQFDKILEKVYNSDFDHVARSFMKLSHFKTWFEASNHLKEVFRSNNVDIYNKDVISFVDRLNEYYSERG